MSVGAPERPRKVAFVVPTLGCGGTERVVTTLANAWARSGWTIRVVTVHHGSAAPCWPFERGIQHRDLGLAAEGDRPRDWRRVLSSLDPSLGLEDCVASERALLRRQLPGLLALRRELLGFAPQVIVSFLFKSNVRVLLAAAGASVPVVVSERGDPHSVKIAAEPWERLRQRLYPRADRLVVLTPAAQRYFSDTLSVGAEVIPNAVLPPPEAAVSRPATGWPRTLLAVGRLVPIKGYDLLIEAYARIAGRHPDWRLVIHGEGRSRPALEASVRTRGLSGRVFLPGFTREPSAVMRSADLFVHTALSEGFPNALCEAMACGLPVVSFDCPSGPRHILRDGRDGVLVPTGDVAALAAALDRLLDDAATRRRLARRSPAVLDRFPPARIFASWRSLVTDLS